MNLFPYQRDGAAWLTARTRGYLADDCGLGKTAQAITAAMKAGVRSVLVIAPANALENWKREWLEWRTRPIPFAVMSWANPKLADVRGSDWDCVIVDEAHYGKSHTAKRSKRVWGIASGARVCYALSATPMPNHPGELYAPVRALHPDILEEMKIATHWQWFHKFCLYTRTNYGPRPYAIRNAELLRSVVKRVMLRRTLDDVGEQLPPLRVEVSLLPKREVERFLQSMDPAAYALAQAFTDDRDGDEGASALRRLLGLFKVRAVAVQIAEELRESQYRKIVVLAYHREVLSTLRDVLGEFGVVGFDGSTPSAKRQQAVDDFTELHDKRVFIAQQTAAGVAINLHVASEIVLVEPAWSPDDNHQAIKRIHRIGQDAPCRARIFAVAGTLDEAIMRTVANKTRMQTRLGL